MRIHLLRVARPMVEFERLIAALRHEGLRVGWLEWREKPAEPLPASLATAADAGVLRAVAVGAGRSVSVKPLRGPAVLEDVLGEHFRGCRLVLVDGLAGDEAGGDPPPLLTPDGTGWTLQPVAGGERRMDTSSLVAVLRRPRPWS